jgi:V8-like Glu-specific endopeptidase
MGIQERVKQATCRVDSGDAQLGSSFWIDEGVLLTAAHVTEVAKQGSVRVRTIHGDKIEAEVVYQDVNTEDNLGSDIAVLETDKMPDEGTTLPINPDIPPIGTEVVWSGYARLIGESKIDRQRFGWGKVASGQYGEGNSAFFEVDGLFNPSHSGGPVVDTQSGEVVGVVSASAGGFERLEKEWEERIGMLQELFSLQQGSSGMLFRTYTYEQPENALHDKAVFERLGLSVETETNNDGNMELQINTEEIPVATSQVQAELSKLLLDTAQATFQMGVGIASGGEALDGILNQ